MPERISLHSAARREIATAIVSSRRGSLLLIPNQSYCTGSKAMLLWLPLIVMTTGWLPVDKPEGT